MENTHFYAFLGSLYPSIDRKDLEVRFDEVKGHGWQCIGLFESLPSGVQMTGIAGYWIATRFCYGRFLYVDHFIVQEQRRGSGVSARLWEHLEGVAKSLDCRRIVLDTFVTNSVAQRFWMNAGLKIVGFHFGKELDP